MDSPRLKFTPNPQLGNTLRQLSSATSALVEESLASSVNVASRMGQVMEAATSVPASATRTRGTKHPVPCCPPVEECPPECLLEITRHAHAGEVILVPFRIRNDSAQVKKYHVGLREMVDDNQSPAPSQPTLDKTQVTINPHQSVMVEMRIDLSSGYQAGRQYEATIVVREKEINQNICFRLILDAFTNVPEATPYDEKDLKTHFVSWHYHFYCDEKPTRIVLDRPEKKKAKG